MADKSVSNNADELPPELIGLLQAREAGAGDGAWDAFLARYNRLILRVIHGRTSEYDAAMDRYAWVLERLREDGFRRLSQYSADGRGKFSTWLVVVVRRLAEDFRRHKYGRSEGGDEAPTGDRAVRRRLADMLLEELDGDLYADPAANDPEANLRRRELHDSLEAALSQLDASDRLLLRLRFEDGLRAREIAGILSLPSAFHVYRRVNSRVARLKAILERRGIDGAQP